MELTDYLELDPTLPSGLRWKVSPSQRVHAGTPAFISLHHNGYYIGQVKRKSYQAHRVVFYLTYGYWPLFIDHIDGNRTNNAVSNLREVTKQHNAHNRVCKGYTYCRLTKKYHAQITVNNVCYSLGRFTTKEEARCVYLNAKQKAHPTAPSRCYVGGAHEL